MGRGEWPSSEMGISECPLDLLWAPAHLFNNTRVVDDCKEWVLDRTRSGREFCNGIAQTAASSVSPD
jgi:hypothetical protein